MPIPLIAVAALAALAAGGGAVAGAAIAGGDDQEVSASQYSPTTIYPYAQYSPAITQTYQPTFAQQYSMIHAPTVQIESPEAVGASVFTEQSATQQPITTVETTQTPSIEGAGQEVIATQEGGDNMMQMLIIGGLALAGIWLFTKGKK